MAGVDVFEEVFKLIFTKLYDEFLSRDDKRVINYFLEPVIKTRVHDQTAPNNTEARRITMHSKQRLRMIVG